MLAYTRIGDGVKSQIKQEVTSPASPSVPESFSMKNIQSTSVMLTWRVPKYPNSALSELKYDLRYGLAKFCLDHGTLGLVFCHMLLILSIASSSTVPMVVSFNIIANNLILVETSKMDM